MTNLRKRLGLYQKKMIIGWDALSSDTRVVKFFDETGKSEERRMRVLSHGTLRLVVLGVHSNTDDSQRGTTKNHKQRKDVTVCSPHLFLEGCHTDWTNHWQKNTVKGMTVSNNE